LSAFDKSDIVEILGVIGAQARQAEGIHRLIESLMSLMAANPTKMNAVQGGEWWDIRQHC